MKKIVMIILLVLVFPACAGAGELSLRLAGEILLDIERNGEAWYVNPIDCKRHYLGRPADAFRVMRELGLGISEINFQKIAQAGMSVEGDLELAGRLAGRIIIQAEKNGEAWYIYPKDLKKYYLGRPADAFRVMRELGLGISRENLAKIHKTGYEESINKYSGYEHKTIIIKEKEFKVDIIKIDLSNPNLQIITDTAEPAPNSTLSSGSGEIGARPLAEFVLKNRGFAGINGTYFCSDNNCGARNYYFYPVYNSISEQMINKDQLKYWTTGPIMVFDDNNNFYYFKDSREFGSVFDFEDKYGVKLQAAIGNKPRLIEEGMNLLIEWDLDSKQKNTKAVRNAIAYKENPAKSGKGIIYLVAARNATVPDLADIVKKIGAQYALNLDGGYSSALWYNDEYMFGPGRDIPNAVIFSE